MTIERLKELKDFVELLALRQDHDDLIALIDAELARRVPDDVQAATETRVDQLIKHYQTQISCYPRWKQEVNQQHVSTSWRTRQLQDQENRQKDDELILTALLRLKGEIER